jgi:Carbon-nitrogen hydrolase
MSQPRRCLHPQMMIVLLVTLISALPVLAQTSAPPQRLKAAAIAFDPAWGDLHGNIARMVAGIEDVAKQGVRLAVLPEQATIGYIFDDFAMVKPHLDTVPGKTTGAIEKVTRAYHMYVVVGIAELDPANGLGYNTAALIGPGVISANIASTGSTRRISAGSPTAISASRCSIPSLVV